MKSTDFITEGNALIGIEADEMHRDQEVQMARSDLYNAADYAIKLHKILGGYSDSADMEQWVMEKIALANDYLRTVHEYLNYENREEETSLPSFQFESANALVNTIMEDQDLEEDWKSVLAGGALAASMALGGGAAHADEAPREAPGMTQQATGRYTDGIDFSSAPYTIKANGKEYKFAGRDADSTGVQGQTVTVPIALIGVRGLKPIKVVLSDDGKYYPAPNINESATGGASVAGGFSTGPVGAAAPMQRRVKKESTRYANAMKTKETKLGKGVY